MSEQPTASIPARFTYVQRKEIAGFLPAFTDRLLLDCKNQRTLNFSLAELAEIKKRAVSASRESDSGTRRNSLRLIRDAAHNAIDRYELDRAISAASVVFRFKVFLMSTHPPIWRQIEVAEGTLDDLHQHIQTAMGWTNSHLHQFIIDDECYGDPKLLDDGQLYAAEIVDSAETSLSTLFGKACRGTHFRYQYDFGDGWEHEVTFEGHIAMEPGVKYPRCIDGERACPPENVGGVWGYDDFLQAISDPRHESHEDMLVWIGDRFDPEKFSPAAATKAMRRGLPNWRDDQ